MNNREKKYLKSKKRQLLNNDLKKSDRKEIIDIDYVKFSDMKNMKNSEKRKLRSVIRGQLSNIDDDILKKCRRERKHKIKMIRRKDDKKRSKIMNFERKVDNESEEVKDREELAYMYDFVINKSIYV